MTRTSGVCLHLLQNCDGGSTHPSLNAEFTDPHEQEI